MKYISFPTILVASALTLHGSISLAQQTGSTAQSEAIEPAPAQEALKVYFDSGSARIEADQAATLDTAARTFREGNPIVMIVAGVADTVGAPDTNLNLSLRRASAVANALAARGIPVERLQVLGRGNSELEVDTKSGVPEQGNRVVEISWR